MKTQKNLSILMPLAVAAMVLVGCSDYDNGYTEKEMKFNADFSRQFGSFDETQDWNLAERANVTVNTSELKDINVYTEKEGIFVQVGAFKNVSGTRKLEFDVIEDMNNLVVSDGDVALRAVVGGIVDFDNMSSMTAVEMGTRGGEYVNRNQWSEKYVVPANITEAERAAVVAEFSKQHYGAFNEVLVPWTDLFVQQVHKGTARYYDAFNQATGTASDMMNHLLIWDNSAGEGAFNGGYIHVNDFNNGNHNATGYDGKTGAEIIGLTLMLGVDPTNCPTEDFNFKGSDKHWVKQFCYHNTQSSEYQPTYIMKRVSWVEDGVTKSGLYLGFDFYSYNLENQEANKNMSVERDWIFNDWIIKISQGLDVNVPVSDLQNAEPAAWILAGEDLGGGFDIDYNDVVVEVVRLSGTNKVMVTPLAAGGTLASYLFFGQNCIGEIHQLLDAAPARSGSYQPINLSGDLKVATQQVEVTVAPDWGLTSSVSEANNMGGFTIRVLPAGTEPKGKVLNYNDEAFDKATDVKAPVPGIAPYILCVPFAYTITNYPEVGQKTENVWSWPEEQTYICEPYPEFEEWVKDGNTHKDWYSRPSTKGFVSTKEFARKVLGAQPRPMTAHEIEAAGNPNADVTFYNSILPSVYPEQKSPEVVLKLKDGQSSDIYVKTNDVIDLLDYVEVTEAYKDKTFAHSGSTGDMDYVGGFPTKLKCVQQPTNSGTTTVSLRLATPGGLKKVELSIHYNGSGTESGKPQANLEISEQNIAVIPGDTHTVTVSGITGNVTVTAANSNVATATLEGNTLTITGVSAGQTGILLTQAETDEYKRAEAYCAVTVSAGAGEDELVWNLGKSSVTLSAEEKEKVLMGITDSYKYSGTPTFTTSNENVATLSALSLDDFEVEAVGYGTATITITLPKTSVYKEASKTIAVTVNRKTPILKVSPDPYNSWDGSSSSAISTSLLPNGTYQVLLYGGNTDTGTTLQYSSNNTNVATVSNAGVVTAHGGGTAIISVTSPQTSIYNSATATVTVTVNKLPADLQVPSGTLSVEQGSSITINATGSGTIDYSVPQNAGTMNGNIFKAKSDFSGKTTITVTQRATAAREGTTKTVTVNVTEKETITGNKMQNDVEYNIPFSLTTGSYACNYKLDLSSFQLPEDNFNGKAVITIETYEKVNCVELFYWGYTGWDDFLTRGLDGTSQTVEIQDGGKLRTTFAKGGIFVGYNNYYGSSNPKIKSVKMKVVKY